jgi:hypothetical protein
MELQEMGVDGQGITEPGRSNSLSVDVVPDMSGKRISGDARFPHLPPRKDVVLKHWTLVSDDLNTADRNSGQYKATFKCNIVDGDDKVSGTDRSTLHYRGKTVSTTNLIRHVTSTVATKEVEILRRISRISWCECS